ncbi:RlmF-related methyltransferase [Agarivorans albus]|uniref:RlmF-related methyltransferase n=1 Tax=Agarivorans albus TaxID=182262 RepID=UPI002044DEFE|nr:RlmF-related methyltransferase [Agarivorans albus]
MSRTYWLQQANARKKKPTSPGEKSQLHPRNKHRQRYDFPALIASCPELKRFVAQNQYGDASVDFFDPEAVRCLNKALLQQFLWGARLGNSKTQLVSAHSGACRLHSLLGRFIG